MGVGGLLTYLSFTRIGGQPSIDRVFEEVSGMKSFPFLAGNKSIARAVFIGALNDASSIVEPALGNRCLSYGEIP